MHAPVALSATPYAIPEGHHMVPGKTYVGRLPGHTRPAFVRKRLVDAGRPPLLLSQIFGSSRRAYSVEAPPKPSMFRRSRSDVYYDYATAKYRPKLYVDQSHGRSITSTQQTCASCGKFRSARWQSRHPLIPGTASRPGLCGRCRDKHTSSEEERPRHHRRRHHRRRRDYTESTDDSYNTSRESWQAARRHRSFSRDYGRRSLARSPSRENVRIIIANQAGDRTHTEREMTRSSSMEPVRVIRRTETVDLPERPPCARSILRSSSRVEYVNSPTQYIENLNPPRYRSRPRGVSRVSYVEDCDGPRSRRRARSSSQVRFLDEADEAVYLSKPRSLKRRRVVYYDGPADIEKSGQQAYSRTPSNPRSSRGAENGGRGAVLVEETITPQSRAPRKAMEQDRSVELIEEQLIPPRRASSQSHEGFHPIPGTISEHSYRQPSETGSYAYESDHDATSRPAFRHTHVIQSPDDREEPSSHHSSHIDFEGARSYRRSYSPALEFKEPTRQCMFTGPETPYRERRERVRESDESSDPDDDDYPRPSPISYRHVEAPEPPAFHSDLLVEMLQSASITPPSAQFVRGRPSQRNDYCESGIPSQTYPRRSHPSEDSEGGHSSYRGRRMPREVRYGGPSLHEPEFKTNAEYDWMT